MISSVPKYMTNLAVCVLHRLTKPGKGFVGIITVVITELYSSFECQLCTLNGRTLRNIEPKTGCSWWLETKVKDTGSSPKALINVFVVRILILFPRMDLESGQQS